MKEYQAALGQEIPADLVRLITTKSENMSYIRRGFDNVVFRRHLQLGLPKTRRGVEQYETSGCLFIACYCVVGSLWCGYYDACYSCQ